MIHLAFTPERKQRFHMHHSNLHSYRGRGVEDAPSPLVQYGLAGEILVESQPF